MNARKGTDIYNKLNAAKRSFLNGINSNVNYEK